MSFVPKCLTCLTCLCVLRTYVLCTPNYYVPTSLKLIGSYVPTCPYFSRAYVPSLFIPKCLRVLNYFVPTCAHFSSAYVPTTNHKIYWSSLLYLVLLFFSVLFGLSFYSKLQNKALLLKLHIWNLSCRVLLSQLVDVQKQ